MFQDQVAKDTDLCYRLTGVVQAVWTALFGATSYYLPPDQFGYRALTVAATGSLT